jgi:regulator of sirC expression with transglutaminase-like and TPR domain
VVLREGESLDLADAALRLAPEPPSRRERRAILARIDSLAAAVGRDLSEDMTPRQKLEVVNRIFFEELELRGTLDVDDPAGLSLQALLERREGTCVTLVILYLAVAERAGLTLHGAATPEHLYILHGGDKARINVETLERGAFVENSAYRRPHRMADESVERGILMAPLSKQAVLAHLVSNRGVLALRDGSVKAALREFDSALRLHAELPAAHYNRGLAHLALEDYAAAREDFTRAIELHPLDAQAFNNRGIASLRLGDPQGARRDFESALRIKPALREARDNLRLLGSGHDPEPTPL